MKQGYSEDRGVGLIGLPVTVTLKRHTVQAVLKNTYGILCLFLMRLVQWFCVSTFLFLSHCYMLLFVLSRTSYGCQICFHGSYGTWDRTTVEAAAMLSRPSASPSPPSYLS